MLEEMSFAAVETREPKDDGGRRRGEQIPSGFLLVEARRATAGLKGTALRGLDTEAVRPAKYQCPGRDS